MWVRWFIDKKYTIMLKNAHNSGFFNVKSSTIYNLRFWENGCIWNFLRPEMYVFCINESISEFQDMDAAPS